MHVLEYKSVSFLSVSFSVPRTVAVTEDSVPENDLDCYVTLLLA